MCVNKEKLNETQFLFGLHWSPENIVNNTGLFKKILLSLKKFQTAFAVIISPKILVLCAVHSKLLSR
jgi:hypothetical protein